MPLPGLKFRQIQSHRYNFIFVVTYANEQTAVTQGFKFPVPKSLVQSM
jgi:hypothetical protein